MPVGSGRRGGRAVLAELKFDGLAVAVTGAAAGIGRASAEVFCELGAHVYAVDIDSKTLAATVEALAGAGARCDGIAADVTREDDAARVHARIAGDGRPLKALINNAG